MTAKFTRAGDGERRPGPCHRGQRLSRELLAIAVRKNSPQLIAALNTFMDKYGLGTAFGNQIERKHLVNTSYAKSATSEDERRKFLALIDFFRKYSDQYSVDFLLMAAQGYQESQLNQQAKSQVGAIGIMQVMPATGRELKVGDITQAEANIHAGVKYMRVTQDTFFKDEPMDSLNRWLFTFAAYNAGPGRVRQLRKEAEKQGLNPNVRFGSVEQIASERIGRETVTYVANIYKYYIAYRLVLEENERREAASQGGSESQGEQAAGPSHGSIASRVERVRRLVVSTWKSGERSRRAALWAPVPPRIRRCRLRAGPLILLRTPRCGGRSTRCLCRP